MDLTVFVEPKLDLPRLATVLDELGHEGRVWAMARMTPGMQARLFEAASGFRKIGLDHFVPADVAPLVPVAHLGHNSLPTFTSFAKVFCKPSSGAGALYGYNRQAMAPITGPGYYVARASTEAEGEVVIDYTQVPPEKPEGWPPIRPNTGLATPVYGGMIDHVRGISSHVAIGRAFRDGAWLDAWFVLVREDRSAAEPS